MEVTLTPHHESRPSLLQRIELLAARGLFRLPHRLQVWLSGRPRVVIDGQPLHPEIQLLLSARRLRGAHSLRAETPEIARARMRDETRHYRAPTPPLASVADLVVPTPEGGLAARHYAPAEEDGPHPLLVFLHGGGFVLGDLDTHDEPCRLLCHHAGVHVLSVEYRLSPEHPFPAAVDDAAAAFRWAARHGSAVLGSAPGRVGVGGDSAGGNLAAVTALSAVDDDGRPPAFQLLVYPTTDRGTAYPSRGLFANGLLLEEADIEWFDRLYLGDRRGTTDDFRVAPLRSPDLGAGCPAVVVTAGFDPLRDEGDAYADALTAAGVPTVHRKVPGFVHGFLHLTGVSPAAHAAVVDIARELRTLSRLSAPGARPGRPAARATQERTA